MRYGDQMGSGRRGGWTGELHVLDESVGQFLRSRSVYIRGAGHSKEVFL